MRLRCELDKIPFVQHNFTPLTESILSEMLWQITDCQARGVDLFEEGVFPDDVMLDSLQVYDTIPRVQVARALSAFCVNVMQTLNRLGLLNYSVLRDFSRCSFVGRDLALFKLES